MRLHKNTFLGSLSRSELVSPVGTLGLICSGAGLRAILCEEDLEDSKILALYQKLPDKPHNHLIETKRQLQDYFNGQRKKFTLPLDMVGTEFQKHSWQVLCQISYGKTTSYQEQAIQLGSKSKCRAVGGANSKNPISIVVPCHRVIGKNGALTGFAGGLGMKRYLLNLEKSHCAAR